MTEREFCYWLQGFFELTDTKNISETQTEVIKEHLSLVFNKVTQKKFESNKYKHLSCLVPSFNTNQNIY